MLVTIISEAVPYACIHPYAIQTPEEDVINDPKQNALYFPITEAEYVQREKRYRRGACLGHFANEPPLLLAFVLFAGK